MSDFIPFKIVLIKIKSILQNQLFIFKYNSKNDDLSSLFLLLNVLMKMYFF